MWGITRSEVIIKKLFIYLLIFILLNGLFYIQYAYAAEPFDVVKKEISLEDSNQFTEIPALWVTTMEQPLKVFISNDKNKKNKSGLFTIKHARLILWKEFSYEIAKNIYNLNPYVSQYGSVKVYYLAVDYEVHKPNEFYKNGINYFLAIIAKENGQWKIAELPIAPVPLIVSKKVGFGTAHEKKTAEELGYFNF